MSALDGLRHRLRALFDPGAHERELREEMALHESLDAGQQGDESRARRRFGNRTYYQEEARDMTWLRFVDSVSQDVRYAWRSLRRTPGFTVTVIVTLALGIGLNAAMFTFIDRVFLRPPSGTAEAGSLRRVWIERYRNGVPYNTSQGLGWPHYAAMRDALKGIAEVAYYNTSDAMALGRDYAGPPVHGVYATANYFPLLGVRAAMGRVFGPDEDVLTNPTHVAVVSHRFWQTRLRADPAIIGSELAFGPRRFTVIGVLDPAFSGLDIQEGDIWFPIAAFDGRDYTGKPFWQTPTTWGARAVLRLVAPVGDAELEGRATAALRATEREVSTRRPDTLMRAYSGPIVAARGPGQTDRPLLIASRLGWVAMMVLLVACANVVNLLLARAVHRRREIAVRLALGVSRARLFRMVTTETLLVALIAGAAALLMAWWGGSFLRTMLLPNVEWASSALDTRVVLFTIVVAVGAGLVAGIVPALQSGNTPLADVIKSGGAQAGAGRSILRNGLVVTQTAMSLVLIVVAALFVRSMQAVRDIDIGYDPARVLYSYLYFNEGEEPSAAERADKVIRVAREMSVIPGVEGVALASAAPMRGYAAAPFFTARDSMGTLGEAQSPSLQHVTPGFFETTGLRVVRGRTFAAPEFGGPSTELVVDAYAARVLWPGEDAIGQCVRLVSRENPCYTVVGVSESIRGFGVIENQRPTFFLPLGSAISSTGNYQDVVVRASPASRQAVLGALDRALRREFPLATHTSRAMAEVLDPQYQPWRMAATLFAAFGALALVVALVGIHSAVAYSVGQRTREFGVRLAFGARVRDVVNQVVGEGMRVVFIGVAIGVVLALAVGRLVASMLFGVQPSDMSAMLLAACTMLLVAGIAALVPALRAGRVDPVVALRSE